MAIIGYHNLNTDLLIQKLRDNRGAAALCVTIFFFTVGHGALFPVLPLVAKDFGAGAALTGLTVGLFAGGRVVMGIPGGFLAQRYGRKLILIGSAGVATVGASFMALSTDFEQLFLSRALAGFGAGAFQVAASICLRDLSTVENRARYQSLQGLSIIASITVGPLIGGFMAETWNLKAPFYFQAFVTGIAMLIALLVIPETKHIVDAKKKSGLISSTASEQEPEAMSFVQLILNPSLIIAGLFNFMTVANRLGGRASLMPLFGTTKGYGPKQLGVFMMATHLPEFFAALASGFISDRFGRKVTILPACTLALLGIVIFIYGNNYILLILSGILMGIGEGLVGPPTAAFFADMAPPGLEGVTMGLFGTYGGVGALLGSTFLGALADRLGFIWALWTDGILLAVTGLIFAVVKRETIHKRPKPIINNG